MCNHLLIHVIQLVIGSFDVLEYLGGFANRSVCFPTPRPPKGRERVCPASAAMLIGIFAHGNIALLGSAGEQPTQLAQASRNTVLSIALIAPLMVFFGIMRLNVKRVSTLCTHYKRL